MAKSFENENDVLFRYVTELTKNKDCDIDIVKSCIEQFSIEELNDVYHWAGKSSFARDSFTPIGFALLYRNKEALEFLLEQDGINPNILYYGRVRCHLFYLYLNRNECIIFV
eukprot:TRINITY_DN1043_c3_g1_i1.p1 TRINITY_DN1043_c3_g1~~TRINITY_DN1043_c3_g1_i1.p1  ORF type:complete len:112 (-),score=13.91 TRINITY_DN1043_c3_g1_i1:92-427(-)